MGQFKPEAGSGVTAGRRANALAAVIVPSEALAHIQSLYTQGHMLAAYRAAVAFGPLAGWAGQKAATLAGRLACNLGAERLGAVIHWRTWRHAKQDPDLVAYHTYTLLCRRGPLATWNFLETLGEPAAAGDPDGLAHYCSVRAMTAAALRDFATAEGWMRRALETTALDPWLVTTQAHLLEREDRYPEALETARRALALRPWFRPAVQDVAHLLQVLDRDEEALTFLLEATRQIESLHVTRQLALLQTEMGLHGEAAASLKRFETEAPLMEPQERSWLGRQRLLLACRSGDFGKALAEARQIDEPYHRGLADRLERSPQRRQVRLEVPFVRQHYLTCAPATLSALSRFWHQPVEHLELAEAICYNGTPAPSERHWAETHGWRVCEFTVTWDAAVALLDRGVPFTLTTVEATSAHLQAVIGYDELRQTLRIRDPFIYYSGEFVIQPLLERYRASGPRGMALVPAARGELIEGLALPDAGLYDQLYQVSRALAEHRRAAARQDCEAMQRAAPAHRLTLSARRALACYDGNSAALLQCLEELLSQFPDDACLLLAKLGCLRELARRDQRLAMLEGLVSQPGADQVFWQRYAQELRPDARHLRTAGQWVDWALRYQPTNPDLLSARADLLWDQLRLEDALRYYRLAACLGDQREQFARSYFVASRHLRQTETTLQFLRARHDRLGARSADPSITLVEALQHLGRTTEALTALETALARRPADGELRLFAADFHGRLGRFDRAGAWLCEAQAHSASAAWHRSAAQLADYQGDKSAALRHWREVLALEPLAHEAIRAAALLLAETEGREAALRFLDELCARFPFSCPLLALRVAWLKEEGARAVLAPLRQLLEVNPADAWAWRELAIHLETDGQGAEALYAAEEAIRLDPHSSQGYGTRGEILLRRGQIEEARVALCEAIRLEVDNGFALVNYVMKAPTLAGRKEALAVVAGELRRQVIFSDTLFAYQEAARGALPAAEVLDLLREAHRARPDLWQSWSVLIHQLIDMGRHEEALGLAREATGRFPLLPRLWADLGRVQQARLDVAGEIDALEKALELTPAYPLASRQLAALHERRNDLGKARDVLERAIVATPLDPHHRGCLAQVLWKLGERTAALASLQHALRLEPGYDWGWDTLRGWGSELGQAGLAAETARDLTRRRAGEARSWLMLARCLSPQEAADELFAALERALALHPRCEEAFDRRAAALAQLDRFDEALAQCAPPQLSPPPARLGIRAAWIEAQRGNLAQAIVRAHATLQEHPEYYGGWKLLADWHLENNNLEGAVEAAEKMTLLAPLNPVPLGYLADLKLRSKDLNGAKAVLRRAFEMDPDYQYAGFQLFHLQLTGGELEEAEKTLAVLRRLGGDHRTRACAVLLAAARDDSTQALALFRELCEDSQATENTLASAAAALDARSGRRTVDRLIETRLARPAPSASLAEVWVDRQTVRNRWRLHPRLAALQAGGEAGRRAVLRYLDQMGNTFHTARQTRTVFAQLRLRYHFRRLLRAHGNWLRQDVEGWGKVGYVLTCIGRPTPVIEWLGDWKQRPQAESWMLYNLVIMLHRLGRHEEASEVIRHAVALRHSGDLYQTLCLWAAFEEAVRRNLAQAERHLATLPPESVTKERRPIRVMSRLLIRLLGASPAERPGLAREIPTTLRAAFSGSHPYATDHFTRNAYLRFIETAAQELGDRKLWLWGRWFHRGPAWLLAPVLALLVPAGLVFPPLWLFGWLCWTRFRPR
jgi:cellulose synthase operon protein C